MDNFADQLTLGDRVKLVSFNNSFAGPVDVDEIENYWKLIGKNGVVMSAITPTGISDNRVLIKFEEDIRTIGLACHNSTENALWIKREDLAVL